MGASQAREFFAFPPVGASQAREFSLFPAVTASQAMEFSLFPPLEALQAAEFQIARQRRLDSPPNPVFFECVSMFLQWFPSKHGTLHFCRHTTGRKHNVRQCFQLGLPKLSNFHFPPVEASQTRIFTFPPWRLPKLGNFRFSPPWGLPKRRNFHFSPVKLPKLRIFTFPPVGASQTRIFTFPPRGGFPS